MTEFTIPLAVPASGASSNFLTRMPPRAGQPAPAPAPVDEPDLEPKCNTDVPSLIPDGDYEVGFVRGEEKMLWGRKKAFLHFRIVQPGDYHGQALFMAVTFPVNGRFTISSKYLQQWILAAGRRPNRLDRLSTKVFKGKVFLGRVRAVKKDSSGQERAATAQYSVLDRLIELRAGA